MSATKDRVKRRRWSLEARQRIIAEALAPGASVAAVARRHDLNANLIFKWLRRSREGWLDRRRAPAKQMTAAQTFVPVEVQPSVVSPGWALMSLPAATMPAISGRESRKSARRGVMEVSLPNGARLSLDADVDAQALRRVLSALGDL